MEPQASVPWMFEMSNPSIRFGGGGEIQRGLKLLEHQLVAIALGQEMGLERKGGVLLSHGHQLAVVKGRGAERCTPL